MELCSVPWDGYVGWLKEGCQLAAYGMPHRLDRGAFRLFSLDSPLHRIRREVPADVCRPFSAPDHCTVVRVPGAVGMWSLLEFNCTSGRLRYRCRMFRRATEYCFPGSLFRFAGVTYCATNPSVQWSRYPAFELLAKKIIGCLPSAASRTAPPFATAVVRFSITWRATAV